MTRFKQHTTLDSQFVAKKLKEFFKEEYAMEYIYFWADTFLAWNPKEFDEFCEMYKDINLSFWIQTRPETVTYEKVNANLKSQSE